MTSVLEAADSTVPSRAAPALEIDPKPTFVRSPVDVLRAIVAVALVAVGVGVSNLFDSALLGLRDDGLTALEPFPELLVDLPTTVLPVAVIAAAIGSLVWALSTGGYRRFALLTFAFGLAAVLSVLVGEIIEAVVDDDVRQALQAEAPPFRYVGGDGEVHPGDPLLAAAVAMVGLASSYLRRSTTLRLGILVAFYAAVSALASGVPALGLVTDVGVGLLVASGLLLIFGRRDLAPNANEIQTALHSVGLQLCDVDHLSVDARGSAPWGGLCESGENIFVKALGRDERSADLMFRAYRWIRLRKTGDHRPFASLQRAVEHEALVSLQAAAIGIRTPRILGVTDVGVDGMMLAYEAIDGVSADQLEDISDEALIAVWQMVSTLHSKRIAHRDLRLANIFIDVDGVPWLIDFGFSELAASDQLLGTDVAELLASTAAVVGTERAVAAAHQATGIAELERALRWLQPLALSSATRQAIGGSAGITPIRTMLVEQCEIPAEEPVKLERINGRTIFILATLALSAWFVLPQLADLDNIWSQVQTASVAWALVAVGFSIITYIAATASLLGAIPYRVRFGSALAAQIASSFANRVTPAKVGGVATNIRYFQRQGVPAAVSVTAVGLNAIAGLLVHVSLTLGFLALSSGSDEGSGLAIPSSVTLLIALAVAVVLIGLSMAVPASRRLLTTYVVPQLKAGLESLRTIGRSPGRLAALFGGSALITLAYLAAMVASLEAFGSDASLPLVGLLFLSGSAVANAAPTPGGIGAAEAALIAALSVVEDAEIVVPAVFLYRLVTFWLPILPGWFALTYLRRTDKI